VRLGRGEHEHVEPAKQGQAFQTHPANLTGGRSCGLVCVLACCRDSADSRGAFFF
jgi:hypothetical protein